MMYVHRPLVQVNAVGSVETHGSHTPLRGVWHDTESHDAVGVNDIEGVVNFWRQQGKGFGAHIIIDKDGNSGVCADINRVVWCVENRNTGTVSIELIGFARFTPSIWLLRVAQLNKLAKWMAWLRKEYGILLESNVDKGWSTHADQSRVYGGTHWDPGPGFPRWWVLRRANKYYRDGWA